MTRKTDFWQPQYVINSNIARSLMEIEAARVAVEYTPLTPAVENVIRNRVCIRSSHYSTIIEGNRLTIQEAYLYCQPVCDNREGQVQKQCIYHPRLFR